MRQLVLDNFEHRQEIRVHEDDLGFRVVQGVGNLVRCQPHVHSEQRRAHHRDREVALQIPVAVPVHHRNRRPVLHAETRESGGELPDAKAEIAVGVADLAAVRDLLISVQAQRVDEQLLHEQRIAVSTRGSDDHVLRQSGPSSGVGDRQPAVGKSASGRH
jgi:hypothetical protein